MDNVEYDDWDFYKYNKELVYYIFLFDGLVYYNWSK